MLTILSRAVTTVLVTGLFIPQCVGAKPEPPSQSAEHAARDGVPAVVAELAHSTRVVWPDEDSFWSRRIDTAEGTWIVSDPNPNQWADRCVVGDPSGVYGRDYMCDQDYAEILLIAHGTGRIIRAYPFTGTKVNGLTLTDDAIYCSRVPDGAYNFPMACRIDRATLEPTVRVWPTTEAGRSTKVPFEVDNGSRWIVESDLRCIQDSAAGGGTEAKAGIELEGVGRVDPVTLELLDCIDVDIGAPTVVSMPAEAEGASETHTAIDYSDPTEPRVYHRGWLLPTVGEPQPSPIFDPGDWPSHTWVSKIFVFDTTFYAALSVESQAGAVSTEQLFPPLFASTDGVSWSRVEVSVERAAGLAAAAGATPPSPPSGAPVELTDVAVETGPGQSIVHATGWAVVDGEAQAVYWHSSDGRNWTLERLPRVELDRESTEWGARIAVADAGKLVDLGGWLYRGPGYVVDTGTGFTPHAYPTGVDFVGQAFAHAQGFVRSLIILGDRPSTQIQTSVDGVSWTDLTDLTDLPGLDNPDAGWAIGSTAAGAPFVIATAAGQDQTRLQAAVYELATQTWRTFEIGGRELVAFEDGPIVTRDGNVLYLYPRNSTGNGS